MIDKLLQKWIERAYRSEFEDSLVPKCKTYAEEEFAEWLKKRRSKCHACDYTELEHTTIQDTGTGATYVHTALGLRPICMTGFLSDGHEGCRRSK